MLQLVVQLVVLRQGELRSGAVHRRLLHQEAVLLLQVQKLLQQRLLLLLNVLSQLHLVKLQRLCYELHRLHHGSLRSTVALAHALHLQHVLHHGVCWGVSRLGRDY